MKIKTKELTGVALDYAVALCEKNTGEVFVLKGCTNPIHSYVGGTRTDTDVYIHDYSPSSDWSQGGPIIDRERITFDDYGGEFFAWHNASEKGGFGKTHLMSAMRCYVASKFGDEVEIPDELS